MKQLGKKSNRVLLFDFKEEEPVEEVEEVKPTKKYIERLHSPEARKKANNSQKEHLTPQEKRFCELYVKSGKGGQSVLEAGYNVSNLQVAATYACGLLKKEKIRREINRLQAPGERAAIATAQQVMEFFTKMMNGEMTDQFGLEISAADKLKAAVELAKRTVDLDNKLKMAQQGVEDNTITIKLDWNQS